MYSRLGSNQISSVLCTTRWLLPYSMNIAVLNIIIVIINSIDR